MHSRILLMETCCIHAYHHLEIACRLITGATMSIIFNSFNIPNDSTGFYFKLM